jgi:hypothetical protein
MWLFGALSQTYTRSLSVFLFDLLGAVMLIVLSRKLPSALRLTVTGLGLALLSISIGDGNLSAALITNTDPNEWLNWRRPFQYFGSFLVTVSSLSLPFALYRQGLYKKMQPLMVVISSILIAGIMTSGLILFKTIEVFQLIFFFVACLITAIFTMQHFILKDNELATTVRQLSVVFMLASLGRLILILLNASPLGDVIYDLLWCAGISAAAWTLIIRTYT